MKRHSSRYVAFAIVAGIAAGCGGSSSNRSVVNSISGTAATGAPIANQFIVIKDRTGTTIQGQTDAMGRYSFPVSGMTPPYLIQVANGLNGPLFSVATAAGTANVTTLTHLLMFQFYAVQGTTPLIGFATPGLFELPTAESVSMLGEFLERTLQKGLQDQGLDPETFDLITTPFNAGGTGYDALLDQTAVDLTTGNLVMTDGVTIQTSTFTTDPSGRVDVSTVAIGAAGNNSNTDSTLIPIGSADPLSGALDAANQALADLRSLVNTKGITLSDQDLVPFLTADALQDGEDAALFATDLATQWRELAVDDARVSRIHAFDDVALVLDAEFVMRLRSSTASATQRFRTQFKQTALPDPALIFGNQQTAAVDGRIVARLESSPTGDVSLLALRAQALALTGTVTKVTVSDDSGVFTAADAPKQLSPLVRVLQPTSDSATWFNSDLDEFLLDSGALAPPPPPPVAFTFTVEPAAGAPANFFSTAAGATDEFLAVTTPLGHLLADALLGSTLLVSWAPPQSFASDRIELRGFIVDTAGNTSWLDADERLIARTATSAHVSFPPQLPGGAAVEEAGFTLTIAGPNGENSTVVYTFSG